MKWLLVITALFFSTSASSENLNFQMEPPATKKNREAQIARMPQIDLYKSKGQVGEADNALLSIREAKSINAEELAKIKKIVDEENADRTKIIDEIVKVNKLDDKKKKGFIEIYYSTKKGTEPKGNYFFESGNWQKKY